MKHILSEQERIRAWELTRRLGQWRWVLSRGLCAGCVLFTYMVLYDAIFPFRSIGYQANASIIGRLVLWPVGFLWAFLVWRSKERRFARATAERDRTEPPG